MPRPSAPADRATSINLLATPLRTLAHALRPQRIVIDQGGAGQCGPNTLSFLLGLLPAEVLQTSSAASPAAQAQLVALTTMDGPMLRAAVSEHAEKPEVLDSTSSVLVETGGDERFLTVRELVLLNVQHWPHEARQGKPPTVETWCELIKLPLTWSDVAFTQIVADLAMISFHHLGVDDLSDLFDMGTIGPCNGVAPVALCEIGVWYNRHFAAVVDVVASAAAEPQDGHAAPPPSPVRPISQLLTTLDEVRTVLSLPNPPTVLVGFEFSGAVRSALEQRGHVALSADFRPCDIGGLHYQGDVNDLLDLTVWSAAYLFPPCYQQLRFDLDCIEAKITDMRAFWGCAQVLRCICVTTATIVIVEQPDTLVADCFDAHDWPDTCMLEFRTCHYGDETDKFVRLTVRNATLRAPPFPYAKPTQPPRS